MRKVWISKFYLLLESWNQNPALASSQLKGCIRLRFQFFPPVNRRLIFWQVRRDRTVLRVWMRVWVSARPWVKGLANITARYTSPAGQPNPSLYSKSQSQQSRKHLPTDPACTTRSKNIVVMLIYYVVLERYKFLRLSTFRFK